MTEKPQAAYTVENLQVKPLRSGTVVDIFINEKPYQITVPDNHRISFGKVRELAFPDAMPTVMSVSWSYGPDKHGIMKAGDEVIIQQGMMIYAINGDA